jgi:hypothetical protein
VLRTAKDLEIRTLYDEDPVFEITRDSSRSDSILGFEWVYQQELIVVSNDGVQFYFFDSHTKKCSKMKFIKIRMNWYQYWPETKLLILSSGSSNLFIYRILPKSTYEIYPTLQLSLPQVRTSRGIEPLPVQVTRLHIHLLSFHGHNYVGFLNNWIGTPTLSLYRVTSRTCYRKEYELNLEQPGSFQLNTVDNLLIVHNFSCKQTLVYDIRSPFPSQALLQSNGELFDILANRNDSAVDLNEPDWYSCASNYVVSPSSGRVFAIQPNLSQLVELLGQRSDLSLLQITEFIIRRRVPSSFSLRVRPIRKAMSIESDVTILRPIFDILYVNFDTHRYFWLI